MFRFSIITSCHRASVRRLARGQYTQCQLVSQRVRDQMSAVGGDSRDGVDLASGRRDALPETALYRRAGKLCRPLQSKAHVCSVPPRSCAMQTNGSSLDSLSLAGIEAALQTFHGEFSYERAACALADWHLRLTAAAGTELMAESSCSRPRAAAFCS